MKTWIWLALLWTPQVFALDFALSPMVRSYATSGSVELTARHDILLWDKRDSAKWMFGFVQPKVMLGAQGVMEGTFSFYPISILELGASYSTTSRFYETKPFDCSTNICKGVLQRHKLTARLALGHEFENFNLQGLFTYHRIRISNADNSKPLVDESEVLLANPGSDVADCMSIFVGAQRDVHTLGIYARKARLQESKNENDSQYLIYRQKFPDFLLSGGVGRYASDFHKPGFSALASVTWSWGESISLF